MKKVHKERLRKLAEYLLTKVPEEKFDMEVYRQEGNTAHICGTAGCALGWAPAIMSPYTFYKYKTGTKDLDVLFNNISMKYFGIDWYEEVWVYLFSANWVTVDNTPQGAAARILYFLDHGIPSCFDGDENSDNWDTSHYQHYLINKNNETNS